MNKEEKIKAITDINEQQKKLLKKSISIAKMKPAKRWKTSAVRAMKVVALTIQVKNLEVQKRIVLSQPIPKFPKGGLHTGVASIQKTGEEIILNNPGVSKR